MARTFEALEKSKGHTLKVKMLIREKAKSPRFFDLPPEVQHQFEKLKSSIILDGGELRSRSILFTGCEHGSGTSFVVANFAESLVQDNKCKVLIVDANTRTPGFHENIITTAHSNNTSFSDLLIRNTAKTVLPEVSPDSNLSLVPSGNIMCHPSQSFDHTQFRRFTGEAAKRFDIVIFDSSPIGRYYDSVILASHLDGVILVVEAEKTPSSKLKRAKQMLLDKNIPILGVILNRRKFPIPNFIFHRFFG